MKKQFIQKLSIAMAAALTMTSVAQVPVSAAAKDMKMDKSSKILYLNEDNSSKTGKTYDFSITKKPKNYKKLYTFSWYADDEAIVSVKKGGVVTAKKVGKTKVYCTIKNKKGKTVANPKATVEVKANAATVVISNPVDTMAPGESVDFNRTMKNFKGGKATDKTEWIVSADEAGTEATDVATVDTKGVVTTAKSGEFYLTARCYQSAKYKERTTASQTIKITVKASITNAVNSAYNVIKLTCNDDMSKVLTDKNISVVNATGVSQVVSGVTFEDNGKTVLVTVYNPLTNDAVYKVTAGDLDAVEFTAKVGEVASIEILAPATVEINKATELKYVLRDANGVALPNEDGKVTFEFDATNSSCYLDGKNITCYDLNKVNTLTAVYSTGKYEAGTGTEIKIKSQPFAITCVDVKVPAIAGAPVFTISDTENAGADQFKTIVSTVAKNQKDKYINVKYVLDDKADVLYSAAGDKWTFESTNDGVLIVDAQTGLLLPVKEGTASIICKYDNKIVNTFTITVGADTKSASISLDKVSVKMTNAKNLDAKEVITCNLKDQYGAEFGKDGVGSAVEVVLDTTVSDKTVKPVIEKTVDDPTLKANQFRVSTKGCTKGTYRYKVTRDNRTTYFNVEVLEPATDVSRVSVTADKTTVDTKITTGLKNAEKDVKVNLHVIANNGVAKDVVTGSGITWSVKNAATNQEIDSSFIVEDAATGTLTIKTVSDNGSVYTKLPAGTYIVSAKHQGALVNDDLDDFYSVDANKKVKIVETRVVVSDTQDKTTVNTKSVKIELSNNTPVETLKAGSELKACFALANDLGGTRTFDITKITTTVDATADKTLKTGTHTIVVNEITTHETINGKTVNTVYTIDRPITVVIK